MAMLEQQGGSPEDLADAIFAASGLLTLRLGYGLLLGC
jgi:hypothetical protein